MFLTSPRNLKYSSIMIDGADISAGVEGSGRLNRERDSAPPTREKRSKAGREIGS